MASDGTTERDVPWGALVVIAMGLSFIAIGAHGYVLRGHFGPRDGAICALSLVPAGFFLLVTSYVVQHARLVAVIPVVTGIMLSVTEPPFAIALGLGLIGAMVMPIIAEWRGNTQLP